MANLTLLYTLALPIVIGIIYKLWSDYDFSKKYKLPPGPKGIPFFGNMFQMPPKHQGPWAKEMAEKYGEMFTIRIADNTWVFLNSTRVTAALLEKRSSIYSSRPRFPYTSSIMSGDCRMVIQPYGPQWRAIRKIMHGILNIKSSPTFAPYQDLESRHLLWEYAEDGERWWKANQRFANSVVMSVVFGKRMGKGDVNTERLFETSGEFIEALQPGANLVDTFYVLDYLPGPLKWWRKKGEIAFQKVVSVYKTEVEDLNRRIAAGTCKPCFATQFLSNPDTAKLGETQTLFALGSIMEAGSDTSRMTLSQIIAAAAVDPSWVKKAQAELDKVCGFADRLPEFEDRRDLPYISAVVKEGFRWRPFAEIGVPHMLTTDDEFEGYRFPAGTLFTWNAWALSLSEDEYEDPKRFWPERWLMNGKEKELDDPLAGHWNFGAGRRVCAGYHVGDTNVWIVAARVLACFDFEVMEGAKVDTMNVDWAQHTSAPVDVRVKVRSEKHRELIERVGKPAVDVRY